VAQKRGERRKNGDGGTTKTEVVKGDEKGNCQTNMPPITRGLEKQARGLPVKTVMQMGTGGKDMGNEQEKEKIESIGNIETLKTELEGGGG